MTRKQIAAANWKMNLSLEEGQSLLDALLKTTGTLNPGREVVVAVPFPYLAMAKEKIRSNSCFALAAQNCHQKKSGAYTGEVSALMLRSMGVQYVVLGHSERREYFQETNSLLAEKLDQALENNLVPIFCCGEPLGTREAEQQNEYVEKQLKESLFHLSSSVIKGIVIAYEPIWAIGTGKTASAEQAQEMHAHIRKVISSQYGPETASSISILYGGSVKGSNAHEIFSQPDVDGGLVGGASLSATEFLQVIQALK